MSEYKCDIESTDLLRFVEDVSESNMNYKT